MSVDQTLVVGCGGIEEHALLLVGWLLGLGYDASLVFGRSLPDGANGAFVLVDIGDGGGYEPFLSRRKSCSPPSRSRRRLFFAVNPCDGQRYALADATCPLFQVGTLVTSSNVYANVAPVAHPSQLDFTLSVCQNCAASFLIKYAF